MYVGNKVWLDDWWLKWESLKFNVYIVKWIPHLELDFK